MSQHLLAAIELLGLVVGLLGFFYLSEDMFGKTGRSFIRPLLPGIALGIYAAVGLGYGWGLNVLGSYTYLSHPAPFHPIVISPTFVAIGVVANAIIGYAVAFVREYQATYKANELGEWVGCRSLGRVLAVIAGLMLFVFTFATATALYDIFPIPAETPEYVTVIEGVLNASFYFSLDFVLIIATTFPTAGNKGQWVKNIGIAATIVAILAQFVSPMLILFNVPITQP